MLFRSYAYDDRWRRMSVGEFLKRRLIRLQPMVVIGALIGAAMFYTQGCSVWDVSKVTVAAVSSIAKDFRQAAVSR